MLQLSKLKINNIVGRIGIGKWPPISTWIIKAFQISHKESRVKLACDDDISKVQFMLIQGNTDNISHILINNRVSTLFKPRNTIINSLRPVMDPIDPKDLKGVHSIPYSCVILYIGETGHSINKIIQEHATDIRHNCSRLSALHEHAEKSKHIVYIEDSRIIARVDHFHHRKLSIEIEKHAINLNRDNGWNLSKTWIPSLSS